MSSESTKPHSYRHESKVIQMELEQEETFIQINGFWYSESSIQTHVKGYRLDQLKEKDE